MLVSSLLIEVVPVAKPVLVCFFTGKSFSFQPDLPNVCEGSLFGIGYLGTGIEHYPGLIG
jgi:hypothetical protein